MAQKPQETAETRREKLSARLVEAALARIEADGLSSLRARDLARDAGCAVGGIYTVFRDMDELILQANAVTFGELGRFVGEAIAQVGEAAPEDKIIAMAHAYLDFAEAHPQRWRALFDVDLPEDAEIPDWYRAAVGQLFEIIRAPLAVLRPDLTPDAAAIYVRTLFSAVHGIVLLGVQRRVSAVPPEAMKPAIEMLLRAAVRVT